MEFRDLGIDAELLRALDDAGYTIPTPIQEKAIPAAIQGRDVLGLAQTGTGKTCAFAIPILQKLKNEERLPGFPPIRSLILTPTRELAIQIYDSFLTYAKYTDIRCALVYGGVSQYNQTEALSAGVDVLVATPGRLNDLCGQGYIDLGDIELFVLDEADRMLDMGFIDDVERIIKRMGDRKMQTLLFSATMPKSVQKLVRQLLQEDFERVEVTPVSTTVETIDQSVYFVDRDNKKKLLLYTLRDPALDRALVFVRTKTGADKVAHELNRSRVGASAIHGDKSQIDRQNALNRFKEGKIRVLVATDIAARGLDISELSHVINYDVPNEPENYVHRIGRTGRAGHGGIAITFCQADEVPYLRRIEKLIDKEVPVREDNPYPMQEKPHEGRSGGRSRSRRGGRGRRGLQNNKPQAPAAEQQAAAPKQEEKRENTARRPRRRRRKPKQAKPENS
ncbi:MAG: DEAD/DEAH box helicase [Eubacteriales bacterium]|nr:DEAD/DEAH box helicase [Eubacteriales bacterium]